MALYNLSGAVIFCNYVLSAIVLTYSICNSLVSQYRKKAKAEDREVSDGLKRRLQMFSALSVLSFSMLSYHMLSFLIISCQTWAETNRFLLFRKIWGNFGLLGSQNQKVRLVLWEWLVSSTLFQDFALDICNDGARFWWTQQALLVTMAWSVFMSFEGLLASTMI